VEDPDKEPERPADRQAEEPERPTKGLLKKRGSSEGWDKPGLHGADLAALLGATVTVLLTITSGPGAWGSLATITGWLLLVALLAFFWRRRPGTVEQASPADQRGKWSSFFAWEKWEPLFVGFALSVVIGCVVAIASAQAVQPHWSPDKDQSECRSVAVAAATTTVHDLSDIKVSNNQSNKLAVQLNKLVVYTWKNGHKANKPTNIDPLISYSFYHQYDATIGDCLAGDTFNKLWWIALPAFLLALIWWYWNVRNRRPAPPPESLLMLKLLECQRRRHVQQQSAATTPTSSDLTRLNS
jgi:MYXO-CTERM domain-containing protein